MSWFDSDDKHTGWRVGGPNGKPVTDKEAAEIIDEEDQRRGITSQRAGRSQKRKSR